MVSDKTRKKMSDARKRWWAGLSEEQRKTYAAKQRGQTKPTVSAKMRGRKLSEEHKAKLRNGEWVSCDYCGKKTYKTRSILQTYKYHFCSRACRAHCSKTRPKTVKIYTCVTCGKTFEKNPHREVYGRVLYCSTKCALKGRCGKHHPNWKGGRQKRRDGYIDVSASLVPNRFKGMLRKKGKVFEHRLVMAKHLGRPLEDWEVVHHKNGVRNDNRVKNLEIHPEFDHMGITNSEQKEIMRLKKRIQELERGGKSCPF